MDLPVVWRRRRLVREVSMSDEGACVGIAFHAMIFDELCEILGRFAEFVLGIRCDSDDRAV
jgi:hypothetical protein